MTKQSKHGIRLLVISQYFYPEQFRINDMCAEWVRRGYDVTVVTGMPNYPKGKFFHGYGWFKKTQDVYAGANVIRLPIISRGSSKLRLGLNYLSFVVSGFFWQLLTRIKADVVFIHEITPMTQALIGVWYGKRREIPVIHYVTDLWPENVEALGGVKSPQFINIIGRMVDYIYANNDLILTSSRSFMKAIAGRGVSADKLEFWPHYAEDFYQAVPRDSDKSTTDMVPKKEGTLNLIFTGNLGKAQGLEILPKAAKILKQKSISVVFYLVGDGRGKEDLLQEINSLGVQEMFAMIERQEVDKIPSFLAQADAGIIVLADNSVFNLYIPTKLQSYMACGLPILASADGELRDVLATSCAGLCVKPGSPEALTEAIQEMVNMSKDEWQQMRNNSISYFRQHFDKEMLMNRFDEILSTAVQRGKSL